MFVILTRTKNYRTFSRLKVSEAYTFPRIPNINEATLEFDTEILIWLEDEKRTNNDLGISIAISSLVPDIKYVVYLAFLSFVIKLLCMFISLGQTSMNIVIKY